jgi:quercetin dioxygenase-like cupin family protein
MDEKLLYPKMIEKLPDIAVSLPGVRGKLFQGTDMQAVFFSAEGPGEIPPHQHKAQWGVLLEGEIELTVEGEKRRLRKGDVYFIPAGAVHAVRILTPMKALDVFDEPDRYRPQTKEG